LDDKFKESLKKQLMSEQRLDINIVMKGQYLKAYELLKRAIGARLTPIIVGPPGRGEDHDESREHRENGTFSHVTSEVKRFLECAFMNQDKNKRRYTKERIPIYC